MYIHREDVQYSSGEMYQICEIQPEIVNTSRKNPSAYNSCGEPTRASVSLELKTKKFKITFHYYTFRKQINIENISISDNPALAL
jgi:hypothetical protein